MFDHSKKMRWVVLSGMTFVTIGAYGFNEYGAIMVGGVCLVIWAIGCFLVDNE